MKFDICNERESADCYNAKNEENMRFSGGNSIFRIERYEELKRRADQQPEACSSGTLQKLTTKLIKDVKNVCVQTVTFCTFPVFDDENSKRRR